MKVKSIIIIIVSIFMVACCNRSYAANTAKVYLDTEKKIYEKGEEIELTLYIEETKTAAFTAYIYFDDLKLDYISGPDNVNVEGNRIIYVWYDLNGGKGSKNGTLAKFKFKAKDNGIADFYINGDFYDSKSKIIDVNFKELQIQIGKTEVNDVAIIDEELENQLGTANTNLEILAIENILLNPPFDNTITQYNTEVSQDTKDLNILAVPEDERGSVKIKGGEDLKQGDNVVTVTVTAPDGKSRKIYQVNVYKRNKKEEEKYEEEQKENQEKLEKIYETEKLSSDSDLKLVENVNIDSKDEIKENKNNTILICAIVGSVTFIIIIAVIIKVRNKK